MYKYYVYFITKVGLKIASVFCTVLRLATSCGSKVWQQCKDPARFTKKFIELGFLLQTFFKHLFFCHVLNENSLILFLVVTILNGLFSVEICFFFKQRNIGNTKQFKDQRWH